MDSKRGSIFLTCDCVRLLNIHRMYLKPHFRANLSYSVIPLDLLWVNDKIFSDVRLYILGMCC